MQGNNSPLIVLCEGASELAYISEINRLFVRGAYGSAAFSPRMVGSGHFNNIRRKYKEAIKEQRKPSLVIWVDRDLFVRNDRKCQSLFLEDKTVPKELFLFSEMNFEDFLMLHCDDVELEQWILGMQEIRHFQSPVHERDYLPLFRQRFPEYRKGELPFALNYERLATMMRHASNKECPVKNGFGLLLKEQIEKGEIRPSYR